MNYLEGLRAGNEIVFTLIMDKWYSRLFNFARGYLNNEENVKEVLQDVFLQLWDNRQKLADNSSLNAYLFALTRNRCVDLIRRERVVLQFQADKKDEYIRLTENYHALSDHILDEIFASELQTEIDNIINKLPEQCRRVFTMSRTGGLKNSEISQSLNISVKTVESHITKALRSIRQILEKKFPGSINLVMMFLIK